MDQRLIQELMTEVANGLDAARSYPLEHPEVKNAVSKAVSILERIFSTSGEFSVLFSGRAFIVGDSRLGTDDDQRLVSLLEALNEKGVTGMKFTPDVGSNDIVNLYSVLTGPHAQVKKDNDFSEALVSGGVRNISLIVSETSSNENTKGRSNTHEEIIKAIRGLVKIARERAAISEAKVPFTEIMNRIEHVSSADWHPYREAMASVVDLLPVEKRVALLQDVEIRPFTRSLLSRMGSDTLVELMTNWERQGKKEHIVRVIGVIDSGRMREIVPQLRNRQLTVYKYLILAGIDILTEDAVSSTLEEHDIEAALQLYDEMVEAQNAELHTSALCSMIVFADRLVRENKYTMGRAVITRISSAIDQEPFDTVIGEILPDLELLYTVLFEHGQKDSCEILIEPFGKILGRTTISMATRRRIIQYLSNTRNPSVLHMLFSLLWESGLYPDVRAAIIGFGGKAVSEAIQLLRDAEDFSVRMKLIDVLKNIGYESIEILTENLGAREWYLRRNIVRIFGEIGDSTVIPKLEEMLQDEDHRVRIEVVRTYGKFNYKDGLLKALNDGSLQVKGEALRPLRRMLDAEEVIDLVSQLGASGDEVYVELLKIVDEKRIFEAVHWIGEMLKRIEWRKDPPAIDIKRLGINTLAKLGGDDAKMILLDLSNGEDRKIAEFASTILKRIS
jgi:hypothetical protein